MSLLGFAKDYTEAVARGSGRMVEDWAGLIAEAILNPGTTLAGVNPFIPQEDRNRAAESILQGGARRTEETGRWLSESNGGWSQGATDVAESVGVSVGDFVQNNELASALVGTMEDPSLNLALNVLPGAGGAFSKASRLSRIVPEDDLYYSAFRRMNPDTPDAGPALKAPPPPLGAQMGGKQRGIFAGQESISNLRKSGNKVNTSHGLRGADELQEALDLAQKMKKAGVDDAAIWSSAGWQMGRDGNWSYEIDDRPARWNFTPNPRVPTQFLGRLEDAFDHPDMYAAYPDMKRIQTDTYREGNGASYYRPDPSRPQLPERISMGKRLQDPLSAALHESGHGIQYREGWDPGTNSSVLAPAIDPELYKGIDRWNEFLKKHNYPDSEGITYDQLEMLSEEPDELAELIEYQTGFLSHNRGVPFNEIDDAYEKAFPKMTMESYILDPQEVYMRKSGETQARNIEKRRPFTEEMRKFWPPAATEDRPRSKQWVGTQDTLQMSGPEESISSVADYYGTEGARDLAHRFKAGDKDAAGQMADEMAATIPPGSVLVPVPGRTGRATETLRLAEELAGRTGSTVADIVRGSERESVYALKKRGEKPSDDIFGYSLSGDAPEGNVVLIDGVYDTGQTVNQVQALLPGSSVSVYASVDPRIPDESLVYRGSQAQGHPVPGRAGLVFTSENPEYAANYGPVTKFDMTGKNPANLDTDPEARARAIEIFNENGGWESQDDVMDGRDSPLFDPDRDSMMDIIDNPDAMVGQELMDRYGYDNIVFDEGDQGPAITRAVRDPSLLNALMDDPRTPEEAKLYRGSGPDNRYESANWPGTVFMARDKGVAGQWGDVNEYDVDMGKEKVLTLMDGDQLSEQGRKFLADEIDAEWDPEDVEGYAVEKFMYPEEGDIAKLKEQGYTGMQLSPDDDLFLLGDLLSRIDPRMPEEAIWYHGSGTPDLTRSRENTFFTRNQAEAGEYADMSSRVGPGDPVPSVYQADLNPRVFDIDKKEDYQALKKISPRIADAMRDMDGRWDYVEPYLTAPTEESRKIRQALMDQGYEGIYVREAEDRFPGDESERSLMMFGENDLASALMDDPRIPESGDVIEGKFQQKMDEKAAKGHQQVMDAFANAMKPEPPIVIDGELADVGEYTPEWVAMTDAARNGTSPAKIQDLIDLHLKDTNDLIRVNLWNERDIGGPGDGGESELMADHNLYAKTLWGLQNKDIQLGEWDPDTIPKPWSPEWMESKSGSNVTSMGTDWTTGIDEMAARARKEGYEPVANAMDELTIGDYDDETVGIMLRDELEGLLDDGEITRDVLNKQMKMYREAQKHYADNYQSPDPNGTSEKTDNVVQLKRALMDDPRTPEESRRPIKKPVRRAPYPDLWTQSPRDMARIAEGNVAPEHPLLKSLLGTSRAEMADFSRRFYTDPAAFTPSGIFPRGSGAESSRRIITQANADRIAEALLGLQRWAPKMSEGMIPWYNSEATYSKLKELVGPAEGERAFRRTNAMVSPFSAGSPVEWEVERGLLARDLDTVGRWTSDTYTQPGRNNRQTLRHSMQDQLTNPAEIGFPEVKGHAYTGAQVPMVQRWKDEGEISGAGPKVPTYHEAFLPQELGGQSAWPIGDAHYSRGVGLADVRTAKEYADSASGPEMKTISPWYRDVAAAADLPAVPAQALQWGGMAHITGVESALGKTKTEFFLDKVNALMQLEDITAEEALLRVFGAEGRTYYNMDRSR